MPDPLGLDVEASFVGFGLAIGAQSKAPVAFADKTELGLYVLFNQPRITLVRLVCRLRYGGRYAE